MTGGYILLHRSLLDHYFFKQERFSEKEAWIWMLMQASYSPHRVRFGSKIISVGRGEIPTSFRKLSEVFGWSSNTIAGYLTRLEQQRMITRKTSTGFLIITVCNYDKYQNMLINTETNTETETDTHPETNTDTNIIKTKENKIKLTSDVHAHARDKIFSDLEVILQSPTPLFSSPISKWLEWGADAAIDILPSAERWKKKYPNKAMRSLAWLDEDIAASIRQRTGPMPETGPPANTAHKTFRDMAMEATDAAIEQARRDYGLTK